MQASLQILVLQAWSKGDFGAYDRRNLPASNWHTHLNTDSWVTWEGGNLKLCGKILWNLKSFCCSQGFQCVWVVKAELIMDMKSSSDFFSVIGVHVTKYIFTSAGLRGVWKKPMPLLLLLLPGRCSIFVKHCLDFFLCIFSSLTCLKKPVFIKLDLLWWKLPARLAVLGSSDQRKVPASLSLFLKSEKNPSSALRRKRIWVYRPFCDFRPVPSAYRPRIYRSQITEGLVLRPFYKKHHPSLLFFCDTLWVSGGFKHFPWYLLGIRV